MTWVRLSVVFVTLALAGLGGLREPTAADDLTAYRVTDPNASFIPLDRHRGRPAPASADGCSRDSLARPIDYFVIIPAFYQDRAGWRRASKPFFAFEAQATGFAADYVRTGSAAYAHCLLALLSSWAERHALLAFDYEGNHGQAWYAIQWSAATAGLAYSIVRSEPSLTDDRRREVEDWLAAVATHQIAYPGNPISCCNNHLYWRGLEAAIVGVVTRNDRLFQFGIHAYTAALRSMNADGSLPLEMERGRRALHYQNFAVLPLVFIAEIAARQGYDLYGLSVDGRDLHLAVHFLLSAMDDPALLRRYTSDEQDLSFIDRRDELNWLEPYHRRFPGPETAKWLARLRPLAHAWTGGPGTLYFAGLDADGDAGRKQALLATSPRQAAGE